MSNLTIRIDKNLKEDARETLEKQGLDMSTAVKMFLSQVVIEKGLPFLPTHNPELLKKRWDTQTQEALRSCVSYKNAEDAISDLL